MGARTRISCRPRVQIHLAGHPVRVLGLATLAELKRGSTTAKDKLTLAILEETLSRLGKR